MQFVRTTRQPRPQADGFAVASYSPSKRLGVRSNRMAHYLMMDSMKLRTRQNRATHRAVMSSTLQVGTPSMLSSRHKNAGEPSRDHGIGGDYAGQGRVSHGANGAVRNS